MNAGLDWLKKHVIELLLTVVIAVMAWEANNLIRISELVVRMEMDIANSVEMIQQDIDHIESSVNDVSGDEQTLREVVEENRVNIGILLDRTQHRYGSLQEKYGR